MTSIMLALALTGAPAFAATPAAALPSTCGASGTDQCVDADGDGHYTNPATTSPVTPVDCDDTKSWVFPNARPTLRDGADSDCDGTDDDAEEDAAIAAARLAAATKADKADPASPKAEAAAELVEEQLLVQIDRCAEGGWWGNEEAKGMWGWKSTSAPAKPTCFGFDEEEFLFEAGANGVGLISRADRRALARASAAEARANEAFRLAEITGTILVGDDSHEGLVATVDGIEKTVYGIDTDGDGRTDRGGLARDTKDLKGRMYGFDTDGDGRVDTQGVVDRVNTLDLWAFGADGKADGEGGVDGDVEVLKSRVTHHGRRLDALEKDGALFLVKPGFGLVFGENLYEADNETVVRAGNGVVGSLAIAGGIAWDGRHMLYAEVGGGQGKRGDLPYSLGTGAVGYTYRFDGGFTLGGRGVVMAGSTGNPLDADVSGWGLGGGAALGYLAEMPNRNLLGVEGVVDVVGSNYGTNHDYFNGPEAMVGVRLVVGGIR
ncbi:hypothetical protein A2348_00340 [Candidatus Uhrbacteria bacterium RIFOXYB12_FULL_58_10]|uniref:EF-hand domain-containing protein n=1 Tax=Candidatus Uhrbacteria bacterium RIFOXYB2_FULL_57_15 TaxID=1802422 RepID=A0A1F7W6G1_9BACT|nr:MAG: hypothetical protein A2348_00340 [Candidatus Uhrbacteria bacterium RIFOXYB12_FULL_58_10]OGL98359.1 MAG: hypothetical protein A2304_01530 [Candidatus Uhrbacteria bacterium RIFOXYB2_FULL_57_15]OGM00186.1 MAG: hypothetical protein A2501_01425 [Candidatus Uhrbacteria bacterium RIFOXYC12_FULL_57_11]